MDIIEMAKRAGFAIHTSRGSVRVEGLPSDLERFRRDLMRDLLWEPEQKPPQFPTMLRKMWTGEEVQEWINKNWKGNK